MPDPLDRFKRLIGGGEASRQKVVEPSCRRPGFAPAVTPVPKWGALSTPFGSISVLDTRLATAYPYSPLPPSSLLSPAVTGNAFFLKDPRLHGFTREKALFLDVETTGLSHGAGTIAFLVGMAWLEGDEIVVRQLLLHDYDQEQAQLYLLLDTLCRFAFLVSYNGKSFDTSVLENRLVLNRFMDRTEAHLRLMPHLDLLHLGRRLHYGRLSDHSLRTLEREVLGFYRPDDIPGSQVPELYFRYLIEGDPSLIEPVLKHNQDDVVSLIHLADNLLSALDPNRAAGDPVIDLNVARLFFQVGFYKAARRRLEAVVNSSVMAKPSPGGSAAANGGGVRAGGWDSQRFLAAVRLLAKVHTRLSVPWQDTADLWSRTAALFPESPLAWVELSKLYERKARLPTRALEYALKAQALFPQGAPEEVNRRVARLSARVSSRK